MEAQSGNGDADPQTTSGTTSLRLERILQAPPERVYRAWVDGQDLSRWLRPRGIARTALERQDLAEDGTYRLRMEAEDGTRYVAEGRYLDLAPGRALALTWHWVEGTERVEHTLLSITFEPADEGTRLILTQDRLLDEASASNHRAGWSESLERLARILTA